MHKILLSGVFAAAITPAMAAADCGEVSITEMNWASAAVVTQVSKFLMEQGYGCEVTVVPSATVPAITSLAENGEPNIVTEFWINAGGEAYAKLRDEGTIVELTEVLSPGGVEGWWIPTYLAEAHPELTTIEGVMANPELVGGRFNNCPEGWGCRILNDNLTRAVGEGAGIEIFNHGSGETLAASLAAAVDSEEPWFGYYWAPTALLGKYDMTKVTIGDVDAEAHARNQEEDRDAPEVSDFPPSPVYTVVTAEFKEAQPEIAELMSKVTFTVDQMNAVLAWQDANSASSEEAAVWFLTSNGDVWGDWLNDEARAKLAALLQ